MTGEPWAEHPGTPGVPAFAAAISSNHLGEARHGIATIQAVRSPLSGRYVTTIRMEMIKASSDLDRVVCVRTALCTQWSHELSFHSTVI